MSRPPLLIRSILLSTACLAAALLTTSVAVADPPAPPEASRWAPAEDLIAQVNEYLADFGPALESADEFDSKAQRLKKDAHTLVVIALALGLHDTDHELKPHCAQLVKAARQLAEAEDYDSAVAAHKAVQAAVAGSGSADAPELKWEPVASLGQLMKQVTFINNRLRRGTSGRRFADRAEENARAAAVLAVIGQAAMPETKDVKDPAELDKWYQYCADMRDAAGEVNARIKANDPDGTAEAMKKLEKSCNDCHAVFRPDQL